MFQHPAAYRPNRNRGFTLIEALVALTILTVGLIPAFNQASAALQLSTSIRNSLTANDLAQEGIELVSAIRDDNWFAGRAFDASLAGCTAGCVIQYDETSPVNLGSNPPLKLDPVTGLYQYTTGSNTPFTRLVTITEPSAHEMKVVVTIGYTEHSNAKTYSLEYHMFDWLK